MEENEPLLIGYLFLLVLSSFFKKEGTNPDRNGKLYEGIENTSI